MKNIYADAINDSAYIADISRKLSKTRIQDLQGNEADM